MKKFLLALVVAVCLFAIPSEAEARGPLRRLVGAIRDRQPVRTFFREARPVRRLITGTGRAVFRGRVGRRASGCSGG